jgi:SagB-type dehydrogenase family enzyme
MNQRRQLYRERSTYWFALNSTATRRRTALTLAALLCTVYAASCRAHADTPSAAPAARRYREVTKHTPASVQASRPRLDRRNKPALYRTYASAETIPLPPPRVLAQPALQALREPAGPPAALDLERLGTLLFLTGGVMRTLPSGRDIRATAAAGALYPNELYAVTADLPGLAAGVYHYDPKRQRLARLRSGDWRDALAAAADDADIRRAPVTVVLTGILWRSAWKYRERAYRHLHWDGGMMLAHLLAAANASAVPAVMRAAFVDTAVERLLGIDGRREAALAVVRLGSPRSPVAPARGGDLPSIPYQPTALSPKPIDYPETLRYHAASSLPNVSAVRTVRGARVSGPGASDAGAVGAPITLPPPATSAAPLNAVVRRRSSTRRFAPRPISAAQLSAILTAPTAPVAADFLQAQRSVVETYVIVHAVTGVPAGAYYFRAADRALMPLAAGEFRERARFLCLRQALAGDASAVIFYLADLQGIGRAFGERGYRLAELEAGLRAGRAYLAAYALGRGATGLTFFDDEVTRFFSPHAGGLEPLLVVAAGVPRKR